MAPPNSPAPPDAATLALLRRRALQYLVHCFLYYRLNESLLADGEFDAIAEDLRRLRQQYPEADMPHAQVVDAVLGPEVSGFQIRDYPPSVISTAFKLLYFESGQGMEFSEFVERRGYRVEPAHRERA